MLLLNKTKKTVLFDHDPEWALSSWRQARGFMFAKPMHRCMVFLFFPSQRIRLHMMFVFAPIDVLVLDGTGKVIALKEHFRSWTYWDSGVVGSAVIELPRGVLAKTKTCLGDIVVLPKQSVTIHK